MAVLLPSLTAASALDPAAVMALRRDERRIVIVGAGGWIGRALLAGLHDALGPSAPERIACFGSSARAIDVGADRMVPQRPLSELPQLSSAPTMLFHLAFLTKDKVASLPEADYVARNRALSATVHDSLDAIGVDRLFVASSGAAAFADAADAAPDLRLYGRLKRDDEALFANWANAGTGRRTVTTRLYSLSGPFINKPGTYALASFVLDALAARPIAVNAPMPVVRSYVAIREILSLVIAMLLAPGAYVAAQRFDSGGVPMELGDVAAAVAARLGGTVARAAIDPARTANLYAGDAAAYAALLRRHGIAAVALADQVAETAVTLASAKPGA